MPETYAIAQTLVFLTALEKNNNKAWLDENRSSYDVCRSAFTQLVQDWVDNMVSREPSLAGQSAKSAIFRLNRDVRFSANKSPYKTNFSAYLAKGGKKYPGAGYYLHIDPKGSFLACGIWMPPAPVLQAIRQEIDYNLTEFEAILKTVHKGNFFKSMEGEMLSRPPKGYDADNPAIAHLKQKSFVLAIDLDNKSLTSSNLIEKLVANCIQVTFFAAFLNRAVDVLEL